MMTGGHISDVHDDVSHAHVAGTFIILLFYYFIILLLFFLNIFAFFGCFYLLF